MAHLGIGVEHEDERIDISKTIAPNILSQSLSDVKVGGGGGQFTGGGISGSFGRAPSEIGRRGGLLGPQPGGIVSRVEAEFEKPTIPRGALAEMGVSRQAEFTRQSRFTSPKSMQELAAEAEVFTPSMSTQPSAARGITPEIVTPQAPVLADIDFTSIEGLIGGFGSVAEFAQNLQKFNRARGITPGGKGKKRSIKPSDILNMIKFQQGRIDEGFVTKDELPGAIDELNILKQYLQSISGISKSKVTERQRDEQTIMNNR